MQEVDDIIEGAPLKIVFLKESGDIYEEILGTDILAGHKPQVFCPGGIWKAYDLKIFKS